MLTLTQAMEKIRVLEGQLADAYAYEAAMRVRLQLLTEEMEQRRVKPEPSPLIKEAGDSGPPPGRTIPTALPGGELVHYLHRNYPDRYMPLIKDGGESIPPEGEIPYPPSPA